MIQSRAVKMSKLDILGKKPYYFKQNIVQACKAQKMLHLFARNGAENTFPVKKQKDRENNNAKCREQSIQLIVK